MRVLFAVALALALALLAARTDATPAIVTGSFTVVAPAPANNVYGVSTASCAVGLHAAQCTPMPTRPVGTPVTVLPPLATFQLAGDHCIGSFPNSGDFQYQAGWRLIVTATCA
jgi:hypothetical protein